MPSPALTVIVSVYEQPWLLDLSLAALAAQDCDRPFEVIVCDDGSSPQMLQVCRRAANPLGLDLRLVWQPDREYRLARSRNNAIRCAQGGLLVFLDGDIVVQPDFLRLHAEAHDEPRAIVCGPRKWVMASASDDPAESSSDEQDSQKPASDPPSANPPPQSEDQTASFAQVLGLLERYAVDVDRPGQQRWFHSTHPWLACAGFAFSVEQNDFVRFDERFIGWGPEDRELVCRLVHRHGHTVRYRDEIEVFHLEAPPDKDEEFDLTRPSRHADIVNYLRNEVLFWRLYPDLDLIPALKGVLRYRVNPDLNHWERIPRKDLTWEPGADLSADTRTRVEAALEQAAVWLSPAPAARPDQ